MKAILQNFLFVLRSFKTSSILNIVGLSVAFAVFSITMMQVHYDFSYDKNFTHSSDIYYYTNYWKTFDKQLSGISIPMAKEIEDKYPEVKSIATLFSLGEREFQLPEKANETFEFSLITANEGFLDVFTPKILIGDAHSAFTVLHNAMLTEDVAQRLFGNTNPIGKQIIQDTISYTVVAVCESFPQNCSQKNGVYTGILDYEGIDKWGMVNHDAFLLIAPSHLEAVQEKFSQPELFDKMDVIDRIELVPLHELHFRQGIMGQQGGGASLTTTLSLLAIGVVVLLIAFVNFMNFSIAMIPARVRSLNIKKILGSSTNQLRCIMASEIICFTLLSFILSLFLIVAFQSSDLKSFFQADLSLSGNVPILASILTGCLVLGVLFGIYPLRYATSFQPAMALSGSFAQSRRSVVLRNVLITIQFFTAIVLIVVAFFIQLQHDYMTDYSWGIQKENVVYLNINEETFDRESLANELKKNPDIMDCTVSRYVPGRVGFFRGAMFQEKQIWFISWIVQHNFTDFFGVEIVEGRNFILSDDAQSRVICNQKLLNEYDLEDILGKRLDNNETGHELVGVVKDINFESLHSGIRPMCFITDDLSQYPNVYMFVKISGNDIRKTTDYIASTWKTFTDTPCEIAFLDSELDSLYKTENTLAKLITIFGLITVLIAVMGIYGLIVFNAKYKAKEIALRKINGSTIQEIMLMLNRTALIQLAIAFLCAVPAAYIITQQWLGHFAYKIQIHWWVFLLGGIIVLLITLITVSVQSYNAATTNPTKTLNR